MKINHKIQYLIQGIIILFVLVGFLVIFDYVQLDQERKFVQPVQQSQPQFVAQDQIRKEENKVEEKSNNKTVYNNFGPNVNLIIDPNRQKDANDSELKYILMWDVGYGDKKYGFGFGREPFYENLCPETRCFTTEDRNLKPVEEFDALVFHHRGFKHSDKPSTRSPHQRYIDFCAESAQHYSPKSFIQSLNGFFNWTLNFRMDADFPYPYGRVVKVREHPEGEELEKYIKDFGEKNQHLAKGKVKDAAWFVSNCQTVGKRETLVKRLREEHGLQVDIYGKCGSKECPRKNAKDCYNMVDREYWFYLSFENSICHDYITEKFFEIMYLSRTIPITYNGVNMSEVAPVHSHIHAMDFDSVEELANLIKKVKEDKALYASYFWWKDFYEVRGQSSDKNQAFCDICAALHNPTPKPKVYEDFQQWWNVNGNCSLKSFS